METIPLSLKIRDNVQKYILRKIAKKYIPKKIYLRPKQTFMAPPLGMLGNGRGREFLFDHFNSKDFAHMGFFDQKKAVRNIYTLKNAPLERHIELEPVYMLMLSTYFIHTRFKLTK